MYLPDFLKEPWMKRITIRPTQTEEIPAILEIILETYKPITALLGRTPGALDETESSLKQRMDNNELYTVLFDQEVIGTFTISYNQAHQLMEVRRVAICSEKQNRGIGSYIMLSAEHLVRLMGEKRLMIETYEDHQQLMDFYLHRGYKVFKKRVNRGNVILLMEKSLWRED
ncbi:MAG: GNAT family N-acetyltransferase [Candidatus Heimdallarchaeota archaeon]|nr:GNAT family N-acetyltransferase [Candidatus Heimdallarchaeota archaeon]